MKLSREDLELRVLKHLISSSRAVTRAQQMGISKEHFTHKEEGSDNCYHGSLFKLIDHYSTQSGGSLLTELVLENKMVEFNVKGKNRGKMMTLWENIQDQDCDENELYDLLMQLKTALALRMFQTSVKNLEGKLSDGGVREAFHFMADSAADGLEALEEDGGGDLQQINFADSAEFFREEYEKRRDNPERYRGIMCGVDAIDKKTFGWLPGQIIVLAAPSSGGKSVQLLNWAHHAYEAQGKNVLYFSLEMNAYECITRHISLCCRTSYAAIKGVMMESETLTEILKKLTTLKGGNYFEYDVNMENPTAEYVDSRIRELIASKGKPDLVVVDYIGIMQAARPGRDQKEHEQTAEVVQKLKLIAKRYEIPILTAQQINRDTIREARKQKEAGKTTNFAQDAISGSQKLAHFAHFIIGLEPDKENGMATYHTIKMRDAWFPHIGVRWNADQHLM